jgi:hypothetical protein
MGEVMIQVLSDNGMKVTRDGMNKDMLKQATRLPFYMLEVDVVTDYSTE